MYACNLGKSKYLRIFKYLFFCIFILVTNLCLAANQQDPVASALPDSINLYFQPYDFQYKKQLNDSLNVRLCSSELKTKYCSEPNRAFQLQGKTIYNGIEISPKTDGEWQWSWGYGLSFQPKKYWQAGTDYQINFNPQIFPGNFKLESYRYNFTTQALQSTIEMKYLQDAYDLQKKMVVSTINFNYPVNLSSLKTACRFLLSEVKENQLQIINEPVSFSIVLDEMKTTATLTTIIKKLASQERFLQLTIDENMVEPEFGGSKLVTNPQSKLTQKVLIPSISSYLRIEDARTMTVKNDKYEPEQLLTLQSNAPISIQELKDNFVLYLLPQDKPAAFLSQLPKKNYTWQSADEVAEVVLQKSELVEFTINPIAGQHATTHSLKFNLPENRSVYFKLKAGTSAYGDFILGKDYVRVLSTPALSQEVKIIPDQGSLISLSGDKKLSIMSLGATKLKFELGKVITSDINHLISQSRGSFSNPEFNYSFNKDAITTTFYSEIILQNRDPRKAAFSSFDFNSYLKEKDEGHGLFFLNIKAVKLDQNQQEQVIAEDNRFILVTNLGFMVKDSQDGSKDVFVQSIYTGKPVKKANVEVLGLNGQAVFHSSTDSDGHVKIPSLQGLERDKAPVAYIVRDGKDLAFMPMKRLDRELNYSKFEVGGITKPGNGQEGGLSAYLFSDRAIYRPGESFNIGMVVKQLAKSQSLNDLPLEIYVTNPAGQNVANKRIRVTAEGLLEYNYQTSKTAPTGIYNVSLYLASEVTGVRLDKNLLGAVSVLLQDFLPDTMKITASYNKSALKGWVTPENMIANIKLINLYGTPAADRRVTANIDVMPGDFTFADFKDYQFWSAKRIDKKYNQLLADATTDLSGKASFDIDLAQYGNSTYLMTLNTEGFEAGSGRSVKTNQSVLVSSLPFVLGYKSSSNLNYINLNEIAKVNLIALNNEADAIHTETLTWQLKRVAYIKSLIKDERGLYQYSSVPTDTQISTGKLQIKKDGLDFKLDSDNPGEYKLEIYNQDLALLSTINYNVVAETNLAGSIKKQAGLQLKLDKTTYASGDAIAVSIISPYTGSGLITLETDGVLAYKWFTADKTNSIQTINIPAKFEGKGFVNVQFVRSIDSDEIYTSPLSYAVTPFYVDMSARDSKVVLTAPEYIKSGELLTITYQTKTPSKIIVFAVNEGILQFANYQNPDPLQYLLNQRALQVNTSQIFDLIMPEYKALLKNSATGGGNFMLMSAKFANPFQRHTGPPVAFWSGIIDAEPKAKDITFNLPDYFNGKLRIMAVAASEETMGASATSTTVKNDLIVAPNLPSFVAPQDEFMVSVNIANNLNQTADITLELQPSEHLILAKKTANIQIEAGQEKLVQLNARASDLLGNATVKFTATTHDKNAVAHYTSTISVRPAQPSRTDIVTGYMGKGTKAIGTDREIYNEFSNRSLSASALPLAIVPSLLSYLEKYPYGCIEQQLSKAFPQVVLYDNVDLGLKQTELEKNIAMVLSRLQEMQNHSGGFGYWPGSGQDDDFISVYALHFMLLAREHKLPVSDTMMSNSLEYIRHSVSRTVTSLDQARTTAYGIYLLTRSGEVTANYLPYLLQYLHDAHAQNWKNDIIAVYLAATYKMLQLTEEANQLLTEFTLGDPIYWKNNSKFAFGNCPFYNSMTRYAQYLTIVSDHFPEALKSMDKNIMFRIAAFIGEGSYNTISLAYAVQAIDAYSKSESADEAIDGFKIATKNEQGNFVPLDLTGTRIKLADLEKNSEVQITSESDLGLFYNLTTTGYDKKLPTNIIQQGLEIERQYLDSSGAVVDKVSLGDEIFVSLKLHALANHQLDNIAIVDLLPGGFAVVLDSVKVIAPASFVNASEDRVVLFDKISDTPSVYRYKIKAVSVGHYTTPPAIAESMYDLNIKAQSPGGHITITP